MKYLRIPDEITLDELISKDFSLSPSMHRGVNIPNNNVKAVRELLNSKKPFDKGTEPGSLWYLQRSPNYFIRTKALKEYSYLLYPKGDAIIPINPKVFKNPNLKDGDILLSKDSNVGECVIVDSSRWGNHMFSNGIVRLNPDFDRLYLFAYLKHPIFKAQLIAKSPRASTITHAKTMWLDCLIPFPSQNNSEEVINYVSLLTRSIIDKEILIRKRSNSIFSTIQKELINNRKNEKFSFQYPHIDELKKLGRLDSAIYDIEYKSKIWLIENYKYGYSTPTENGFNVIPGPSLEIKIIKTRIDSEYYKLGFYALILPTHISKFGTLNKIPYLGTGKKLPLLLQGDVIFGEAGFHKGRSLVLLEGIDNCTTNAHGLYARRKDGNIQKSIFFRCIFDWYRKMRLIDLMAVGGSGGHFSPEYFDYLRIPKFPEHTKQEIVKLYHNSELKPKEQVTLSNFLKWHQSWNSQLGIWELDREIRNLKKELYNVQEKIIEGEYVEIPYSLK